MSRRIVAAALALLLPLLAAACSPGDGDARQVNGDARGTPLPAASASGPATPMRAPTRAGTTATPIPVQPCIKGGGVGDGLPGVDLQARMAQVIAIVAVREVLPARWDTGDGLRPSDACREVGSSYHHIFRPVWVEVERYLKGEGPGSRLLLEWEGGEVGQDRHIPGQIDGYMMDEFSLGARVVIFLTPPNPRLTMLDGAPLWSAPFRYAIAPDGAVTVRERDSFRRRTIVLQQFLDEIAAAP